MRLASIVALVALPLASCAEQEQDTPVVETEAVPESEVDTEMLAPADQSLTDPAEPSVTGPADATTTATSPDTPAASDVPVDPEAVGEQYQDFVGGETN